MENIFFDLKYLKSCGSNVIIGKTVRIRNPELVEIGDNVIIDDYTLISGNIKIGNYVHIASGCTLQASKAMISIGSFTGISSGSRIYAVTSNYLIPCLDMPCIPEEFSYGAIYENTTISNYVLIGANCVVLNGVYIPEGVAFGAGIVIRKRDYEKWRLYSNDCENSTIFRNNKKYLKKIEELLCHTK